MINFNKLIHIVMTGVVLSLVAAGSAMADWGQAVAFYPGEHMMGGGYMSWMMIFFWGILLVMLILLIRWVTQLPQGKIHQKSALDILKERLAKGEIDIDEFKEKKELI